MSEQLSNMLEETRDKLQEHLRALNQEMFREIEKLKAYEPPMAAAPPPPSGPTPRALLEGISRFSKGTSQVEILKALVDETARLVPRTLMLIRKGGNLHGWAAKGFGEAMEGPALKRVAWPVDAYPEIHRVTKGRETIKAGFSDLSQISEAITELDGYTPFKSCFFPLIVKGKVAAVLYIDSGSEPTFENQEAAQLLCHVAGLELTALAFLGKKGREPRQTEAPATPDPEPPTAEPRKAHVLSPVEPEPHPGFHPDGVAEAKPTPKLDMTSATLDDFKPEVPDFPVSGGPDPGDEDPGTKKAKRVARVLVSDLKLYNETAVNTANGDLYSRLKEDIDRSFEHYRERTKDLVSSDVNYFKDEIIRQLGGGDPAKIGPLPF